MKVSNEKARITIYDTTLRDGQQGQGIDFTLDQKIRILRALDALGVDYAEGGWPGSNATDTQLFESPPSLARTRLVAFGMTKRAGRSAQNDPVLASVVQSGAGTVCLVGKSHPYHVTTALGISLDENLEAIRDSVAHAVACGNETLFDAEHFFDGYRADPGYAEMCIDVALEAGARWAVLCDTNGGTLPGEVSDAVGRICASRPGERIGIHTHNDSEVAVANSLAAIDAGARQVQSTVNGVGERCGNANLLSILANLSLKDSYSSRFETGVKAESLRGLTGISRMVDEILNETPSRRLPYVGSAAFTHKAGLHVSAVVKHPDTYEHVNPETVGNRRVLPVSRQAGRANLLSFLHERGIALERDDPRLESLLEHFKELEDSGYSFESADASCELRARRFLGLLQHFFEIERYRVSVERRRNSAGEMVTASEAVVVARVDGERLISASESVDPEGGSDQGPVNALARALRKDLGKYQQAIEDVRLVDYKVRILTSGTEAVTRVLIESADKTGRGWATVGVSANIVDASFEALLDSIEYKLLLDETDGLPDSDAQTQD